MKPVKTQFKPDMNKNNDTTCQAKRQSYNIDKGEQLVFPQMPESDFKIYQHMKCFPNQYQLNARDLTF
jgi:hypothetical protein